MFFNLARNEGAFGKMIYFGSGAEYDSRCLPARVKESYFDTRVPADLYGFSKYICSKFVERSTKILNLRLFAVFGKYEAWQVRFISNACARVVHGLPIVIRKNAFFDYLYVDDLAKITCWFVENQAKRQSYNVCRGKGYELTTLATMVADVSAVDPAIVVKNEGIAQEYTGDNSRLLRELNGYEFGDMRDCISELYLWYVTNKHAVDPSQLGFDE
jgi:UDP-glucose 4-epimerase